MLELPGIPSGWTWQSNDTQLRLGDLEDFHEQADCRWPFDWLAERARYAQPIDALWEDACRSVELSDSVESSYRRGKTISLYHEQHSEEETFKSMMAAGGCLALLLTLVAFPLLVLLGSLPVFAGTGWDRLPWRLLHPRIWPAYLLVLLLLFLGMQLFRLVFVAAPRAGTSNDADRSAGPTS